MPCFQEASRHLKIRIFHTPCNDFHGQKFIYFQDAFFFVRLTPTVAISVACITLHRGTTRRIAGASHARIPTRNLSKRKHHHPSLARIA